MLGTSVRLSETAGDGSFAAAGVMAQSRLHRQWENAGLGLRSASGAGRDGSPDR